MATARPCLRASLLLTVALVAPAGLAVVAGPAGADHVPHPLASEMAGVGKGTTFSFCFPQDITIAMAGAGADGTWTLQWTQVWPNDSICPPVMPLVWQGPYNPTHGGCLPNAMEAIGGQLCLDPVPVLGPTTVGWRICSFEGPGCTDHYANFFGTITVVLG